MKILQIGKQRNFKGLSRFLTFRSGLKVANRLHNVQTLSLLLKLLAVNPAAIAKNQSAENEGIENRKATQFQGVIQISDF